MTPPRASAEEIIRNIGMKLAVLMPKDEHWRDLMTEIADQIQQAVNEAWKEALSKCDHEGPCDDCIDKFVKQGHAQGFAEGEASMRERAAKAVDICKCEIALDYDGLEHILEESRRFIRALPPRGSGT